MEEIETLLIRLGMAESHFDGVCACPEGKPVVLVTMKPGVDISQFLYKNESYIVKEGVRTTAIRQGERRMFLLLYLASILIPRTRQLLGTWQLMARLT